MLVATTIVALAMPTVASAVPDANISNYEWGWCCSGDAQSLDREFKAHEFEVENTGDVDLAFGTLRVTFDPTKLEWTTAADDNANDSELYAGYYDGGGAWTYSVQHAPLSTSPTSCVEAPGGTATQVTYECDLEGVVVQPGLIGWAGVRALLPAPGFEYGNASVTYELSFVGDPIPLHTYVEDFEYNAIASNMQVQGGYVGDPDLLDHNFVGEYRDYDGESTGVVHEVGDVVSYRFLLTNPAHDTDPTGVAHGVTVDFNIPTDSVYDWETEFLGDGQVEVTGDLSNPVCVMQFDGGDNQDWQCEFDGAIAVGGSATVTLPIRFIDAVDQEFSFDFNPINGVIDSLQSADEQTYTSANSCELPRFFGRTYPTGDNDEFTRYQMYGTASIANLETGDPIRFQLPCEEPEATPLTNFSSTTGRWDAGSGYSTPGSHLGIFRGPANASYAWLSNEPVAPGPNGEYAFTWEAAGLTGLTAGDVLDTARIAARPAIGGDYYRIMFHVAVEARSDLSVALAGPTALEVAASGAQATYTATVTNGGPDDATSSHMKVQLPAAATFVSGSGGTGADACTAAGQRVTCTLTDLASGDERTFTVVTSYKPGVNGLSLPATANVSATAELLGAGTSDPDSTDDVANMTTSLTAAPTCAAGQTGTPPNCVTPTTTQPSADPTCAAGETGTPPNCVAPKVLFGGPGNRTYRGTAGNDRFTGGRGHETFFGGGGSDTADGGRGNDRLYGSRDSDTLLGGLGNDRIFGGAGDDLLRGGAGDDIVSGGPGLDDTRGGSGDDNVSCGSGPREKAFGNAGNDVVSCRDGAVGDTINGGAGTDTCIGDVGDVFVGCERIVRITFPRF